MSRILDWRTKLTARTILHRIGYGYLCAGDILCRKFDSCDFPHTDEPAEVLDCKIWPYVEALLITTDPHLLPLLKEKESAIIISLEGDIAFFKVEGVPDNSAAIIETKKAIVVLQQLIGLAMRPAT